METQAERLITILTKTEHTHLPRKRLSRIPCLAPNPIKIKIKKVKNQVRKRIRKVINTVESQELSKGGPTKNQATKRRQGTKSRNKSVAGPAGLKGKGGRSVLQGTQLEPTVVAGWEAHNSAARWHWEICCMEQHSVHTRGTMKKAKQQQSVALLS
jgi:hypothetical protein